MKKLSSIVIVLFFMSPLHSQHISWDEEYRIDWNQIDLSDDTFWSQLNLISNDFTFGVSCEAHKLEGTKTSGGNYIHNSFTYTDPQNRPLIDDGCQHWDRYQEDIQRIKNLGVDTYRLSIPWEKIEPHEGAYNEEAIAHYIDICKRLRANNIEPIICLFHFKLPVWFYEQGGFEKRENCAKFVQFSQLMMERLRDQVVTWITYNEPIAYVMESYFTGKYPPYKKGVANILQAGTVLKNMLNTHVAIYQKGKDINNNAQIGFVKMFHLLDSYNQNSYVENFIVRKANHIIYDVIWEFFKTGHFNWLSLLKDNNPEATKSLDYIGVNYYTHEYIKAESFTNMKRIKVRSNEQKTAYGRAIYPEGLYRALLKAQELNVPVYVTENGINDPQDTLRNEFIKKHLYIIDYARKKGLNVRSYTYWSFMELSGYGLFAFDQITSMKTLRNNVRPFQQFLLNRKRNENRQ